MNISLPIPEEMEQKLREYAAATGQDLEHFVLQAVEEKLADSELPRENPKTPNESILDKLKVIMELTPNVPGPVDDSRESIYGDRGL